MKKVHNFYAGPCVLPGQAVEKAIEALKDFKGTGVPVISISHRSKEWVQVMDECRALWKELLHIPDTHEVLFMGGGASLQFLCVAMNFLEKKAGYLETGVWAKKALKEAKGIGDAYAVASSADTTFSYIPKEYEIPEEKGMLVQFKFTDVSLLDFQKAEEIMKIGYRRTLSMIDSIKQRVKREVPLAEVNARRKAYKESLPPLVFKNIYITGVSDAQKKYIESQIHRDINEEFSM